MSRASLLDAEMSADLLLSAVSLVFHTFYTGMCVDCRHAVFMPTSPRGIVLRPTSSLSNACTARNLPFSNLSLCPPPLPPPLPASRPRQTPPRHVVPLQSRNQRGRGERPGPAGLSASLALDAAQRRPAGADNNSSSGSGIYRGRSERCQQALLGKTASSATIIAISILNSNFDNKGRNAGAGCCGYRTSARSGRAGTRRSRYRDGDRLPRLPGCGAARRR